MRKMNFGQITMKANMKLKSQLLLFILLLTISAGAQQITGIWYSKDGARAYDITENNDFLEAVMVISNRPYDKTGKIKIVLGKLNKKGTKYRGIIYASDDDLSTTVTVKYIKGNNETLRLRLKRMMFLDVIIKWYRNPA